MNRIEKKDFYTFLSDGGWVAPKYYNDWWGGDKIKKQRLAIAIVRGKIDFQFTINNSSKDFPANVIGYVPSNNYYLEECKQANEHDCIETVNEYLSGGSNPHDVNILLDAKSLLAWLNKTYPLESGPVQKEVFMSYELAIAIECSRTLYSSAPARGATAKDEGPKISDWIKEHYPDLVDAAVTRVTRVVNPGVK